MRKSVILCGLLAILGLSGLGYAAEPVQLCPGVAPNTKWDACPKWTCGAPATNDDIVQSQVGGGKFWVKLSTVPPTGLLARCAAVNGNWWATRQALGIGVISPPVAIYPWEINWNPPTANVDGSPLTDLKSWVIENSGTRDGPWASVEVTIDKAPPYIWNLPTSVRQCFRVSAIGTNRGAASDVYCVDPPTQTPGQPTGLKATPGPTPVTQ